MTQERRSVTGTVLFGERIPDIKPERHPRADMILSSEVITWLH